MNKSKTTTTMHKEACRKYKEAFLNEHDYPYCEMCGVNISGAINFETHHIVYASEAPKHKYLHDSRNLIMVCMKCHRFLHSAKKNRNNLILKRGLNKLFNVKLLR